MEQYISTKVVNAISMNRAEYNKYRGWELPSDEDGFEEGYLIEYLDGGKPNHPEHQGYISWSPSDVFDQAYKLNGALDFGTALSQLNNYKIMTRLYNPGYYVFLVNSFLELPGDKTTKFSPFYSKYDIEKSSYVPYIPTHDDMLATDWHIVEIKD